MREKERQVIPPCKLSNLSNRLANLCVYFRTPLVNVISRIYTGTGDGRLFYERNTLLVLTFSDTDESMLVLKSWVLIAASRSGIARKLTESGKRKAGKRKAASDN